MRKAEAQAIVAQAAWEMPHPDPTVNALAYATTHDPNVTREALRALGIVKTHVAIQQKESGEQVTTVYGFRNLSRLKAAGATLPDIPDPPEIGLG